MSDPMPQAFDFPIVAIGCSAGGLEALEKFFTHVPADSGMGFVVVQHLDPKHPSALPELLRRFTSMPVTEAGDDMAVEVDRVYVIPPDKDLSLRHGKLHPLEPAAARGPRLPIDFFLRSLAADRGDKAIGVILSGMGSDGALGLRAIKEHNGLTLVQEPATAQADSMPRGAIEAGLADIVAPVDVLAKRITEHRRPQLTRSPIDSGDHGALEQVVVLLRNRCGNDFSLYKSNTLHRRIERRMAVHQVTTLGAYVRYLRANPAELDLLYKELLIGVTNFFRDAEVWETLRTEGFPALLDQYPDGKDLRAWVCACSTGEEAYSLAMVFRDVLEQRKPDARYTLQIYATDIDADAIDQARRGYYPDNIAVDVSTERLTRYFIAEEKGGYRITGDIRAMVVFAKHNVVADPPFTNLDLLTCRNLLIYLEGEVQKKLLPIFHYGLNPGGLLLLGSSESVGGYDHLFMPFHHKSRLYRRRGGASWVAGLPFFDRKSKPADLTGALAVDAVTDDLGRSTDQFIQQHFAPAAVLVNSEGDILYISGRTGKYLEPAAGKTNMNLHAMARDGLREALSGMIFKALHDPRAPIVLNGLRVGTNGGTQIVDVTLQAIEKPELLRGRVIVVFRDGAAPPIRRRRSKLVAVEAHDELRQELEQTHAALQLTREEMQTTIEELRSSNEELQSTNEELQSTNEELTTSKEELQSLNEELQTVNAELQSKVDELTGVRNDMANLLNSTEIATIFLDDDLKLRRFTPDATKLFKFIPCDVGRPLTDLVTDLDFPLLYHEVREVMRTLVFHENVVSTRDGRWYRVRIMPYRTQNNVIEGVVITFIDITEIKKVESELRQRVIDATGKNCHEQERQDT